MGDYYREAVRLDAEEPRDAIVVERDGLDLIRVAHDTLTSPRDDAPTSETHDVLWLTPDQARWLRDRLDELVARASEEVA